MNGAAATTVDRHVVIVTAAGSFTAAGERLTGPVDWRGQAGEADRVGAQPRLLQPQPIGGAAEVAEARTGAGMGGRRRRAGS